MNFFEITEDDLDLIRSALKVLEKNFDEGIYRHTVGSAIRCANGKIYLGVNCYDVLGACAEYVAMGAAITAGERDFDTMVAVKM